MSRSIPVAKSSRAQVGEIIQFTTWEDALEYHNDFADGVQNPLFSPSCSGLVLSYHSGIYLALVEGQVQQVHEFLVDRGSAQRED